MTGPKAVPEHDAVTSEIEIAAPPQRVFAALTDAKQLFAWWGKEPSVELSVFEMDARPGGRWRFRCRPVKPGSHGELEEQLRRTGAQEFAAQGEVLEYDPPRLLVWSWIANWHEASDPADDRSLGADADADRYTGSRDAQWLGGGTDRAQGLRRWLAGRAAVAEELLLIPSTAKFGIPQTSPRS